MLFISYTIIPKYNGIHFERFYNTIKKEVGIMGGHNCYTKDASECIKKKAYELWDKEGRKQGRDLDYWLRAEKAVKTQTKK
jgi:hypothetical protein